MFARAAKRSGRTLLMMAFSAAFLLSGSTATAQVADADVETSFEFTDTDGFTLGTAPFIVSFSDGEAKTVNNPPLYQTGFNSFMTPNGATSAIDFETPAEAVEFYAKQEATGVAGLIEVYDPDLNLLQSIDVTALTNAPFQNVLLEQDALGAAVRRITLSNNSTATSPQYLVIDDFSFRAVPEPTSLMLLAMVGVGLAAAPAIRVRRRHEKRAFFAGSFTKSVNAS